MLRILLQLLSNDIRAGDNATNKGGKVMIKFLRFLILFIIIMPVAAYAGDAEITVTDDDGDFVVLPVTFLVSETSSPPGDATDKIHCEALGWAWPMLGAHPRINAYPYTIEIRVNQEEWLWDWHRSGWIKVVYYITLEVSGPPLVGPCPKYRLISVK